MEFCCFTELENFCFLLDWELEMKLIYLRNSSKLIFKSRPYTLTVSLNFTLSDDYLCLLTDGTRWSLCGDCEVFYEN